MAANSIVIAAEPVAATASTIDSVITSHVTLIVGLLQVITWVQVYDAMSRLPGFSIAVTHGAPTDRDV